MAATWPFGVQKIHMQCMSRIRSLRMGARRVIAHRDLTLISNLLASTFLHLLFIIKIVFIFFLFYFIFAPGVEQNDKNKRNKYLNGKFRCVLSDSFSSRLSRRAHNWNISNVLKNNRKQKHYC